MSVEIVVTDQIVEINEVSNPVEISVSAGSATAQWGGITGTLSNQTDLQNALNAKVPYTGATANVDLGEFELKAGQIEFDQTPTGVASAGVMRWNDTTGVSETTLKGGSVILRNGVDLVARVVNKVTPNTTLTKAAYQAVRVSGAQGQRLAVAFAQANNDNNSADTIGLVTETIATNQEGFIMAVGQLENINTTGSLQGETWVDGDVLYLSPTTAGRLTNIKPVAPNHIIVIGYVEYAHANNGKIYVKVMNGWELGELHDVDTTGAVAGNVLKYNGTIWTPSGDVGITSLNGLTATTQTFATGTSGTDFNISSATSTHTFNLPSASAANRGLLTSADWTTFNNKENVLTFSSPLSRTTNTISIPQATGSVNGFLSSTDWTTFNNKQNALTNPVTGTGVSGQVSYWNGTNTQVGSNNLFWDAANNRLGIGTNTPSYRLQIVGNGYLFGLTGGGTTRMAQLFSNTGGGLEFGVDGSAGGTIFTNASAYASVIGSNNATPLQFATNATVRATLDASGNLGLGVTPSAWSAAFDAMQFGFGGAVFGNISDNATFISSNYFTNGAGQDIRINTGFATILRQSVGAFDFFTAPSGAAGSVASLTQVMKLNSTGNLLIGSTTDSGQRLQVTGDTLLKGSGTTSATIGLNVQDSASTNLFRLRNDGSAILRNGLYFGTSTNNLIISSNASNTVDVGGLNLSLLFGSFDTAGYGVIIGGFNASTRTVTSGASGTLQLGHGYAPTSGTGTYTMLNAIGTINQTGGANGITRGLYVNPTLTAAADWRSIETSNNSGWSYYGAGTANSFFGGSVGIGTTSLTGVNLYVLKPLTGSTQSVGIFSRGTIQSDVTQVASYFRSFAGTQAATFTLSLLRHFSAEQTAFGAGSTVDDQMGFYVDSTLINGTRNYGFYGNIASGTGRWNLYMNGTAANHINGSLAIGTTSFNDNANPYKAVIFGVTSGSANGGLLVTNNQAASGIGAFISSVNWENHDGTNTKASGFFFGRPTLSYPNRANPRGNFITNIIVAADSLSITNNNGYINHTDRNSTLNDYVNYQAYLYVQRNSGTVNVNGYQGFRSVYQTAVGSETITNFYDFVAAQPTLSASALVTNRYGLFIDFNNTQVTNAWGLYQTQSTVRNYLNGELLLGSTTSSGERLQVNGTMKVTGASTFGGNMSLSLNQNAPTILNVSNTNNNTGALTYIRATSSAGYSEIGKFSASTTAYKIITANSGYLLNGTVGDLAILNDVVGGSIKFASNASANTQMILTSSGNLSLIVPTYASNVRYGFGNPARTDDAAYIEYVGVGNFTGHLVFGTNASASNVAATEKMRLDANGNLCIGVTSGSDFLNIGAGTTAKAQINLAASTAPTTPNNGDIWFDGTNIKIQVGGVTKTFTLV